LEQEGIK
jgi:hypothetical protein